LSIGPPPEARLYHRLLARAPEDAAAIVDEAVADGATEARPMAAVYDALVVPALHLAERDRLRGTLDDETLAVILEGVEAVIDEFTEPVAPAAPSDRRILCVAGRGPLDEALAALLADLLVRDGVAAEVVPCEAVGARRIVTLDAAGVGAVVACYLTPGTGRHMGRLARRLTRRFGPAVPVSVCCPGSREEESAGATPAPGVPAHGSPMAAAAVAAMGDRGVAPD